MTVKHHIRPAEFRDVESIFGLIKEYPEELLPRPVSDIVQNIDRFLISEHNRKLAGTISWQILPEIGAPTTPSIEIKSLAVARHLKGTGVGQALVREAIDHIKHLQPAQIIALTFSPEFFEKLGFQRIDKERLMHKIYGGCINCSKYDSPFTCPEVALGLTLF